MKLISIYIQAMKARGLSPVDMWKTHKTKDTEAVREVQGIAQQAIADIEVYFGTGPNRKAAMAALADIAQHAARTVEFMQEETAEA